MEKPSSSYVIKSDAARTCSAEDAWAIFVQAYEDACFWTRGHKYWRSPPMVESEIDPRDKIEYFWVRARMLISPTPTDSLPPANFTHNGVEYRATDYFWREDDQP